MLLRRGKILAKASPTSTQTQIQEEAINRWLKIILTLLVPAVSKTFWVVADANTFLPDVSTPPPISTCGKIPGCRMLIAASRVTKMAKKSTYLVTIRDTVRKCVAILKGLRLRYLVRPSEIMISFLLFFPLC